MNPNNKLEMEAVSSFGSDSDTSESSSSSSSLWSSSSHQNMNGRDKGGTEQLKKLRSIKMSRVPSRRFRNQGRRIFSGYAASSEQSTPIDMSDASPNHMKPTSLSDVKQNVQKSAGKLTKRSTSRPVKSMTRLPSMRFRRPLTRRTSGGTDQKYLKKSRSIKLANPVTFSMKPSMKKHLEMPQTLDSSIQRATCSSAIKSSKVPEDIEPQPGGSESERLSAMKKVCPYSYCSLHGHRHDNIPPLKRYVSMRRRSLKSQKNVKSESRSTMNRKKGIQKTQRESSVGAASSRDIVNESTAVSSSITDEDGREFSLPAYSSSEKRSITFSVDESSVDSCSITNVQDKSTSEATGSKRNEHEIAASNNENLSASQERQKHMGLWRLIYQHMTSGTDAEVDRQQAIIHGENKEKQMEEANEFVGTHDCSFTTSPTDQSLSIEDHDRDCRKTEIYQSDAVKLVQDAFDRILSEIPDQSPDDQSIAASDITTDNELSFSTSSDSAKYGIEKDTEKTQLKDAKVHIFIEEKVASNVGKKSDQQMPKSWNNLKKIILLKRFVKALEKVKHFNPQTPEFLSVEPDPEAERVHLRHLTVEGRKNPDKWMLDHALRQVVSTLAPAQKRKVALLVQAFETIIPIPELESHQRSNSAASSHKTAIHSCTGSSAGSDDEKGKENKHPDMNFRENQEQVTDILQTKWSVPMTAVDLSVSKPNVTELDEEGIYASHCNSKTRESIFSSDQLDSMDSCLPEVEETKLKDESSTKGIVNNSQEQSPEKEKDSHEVVGKVVFCIDSEARGRCLKLESENDKVPASNIRAVLSESFTKLMERTPATGDEECRSAHESLTQPNGVSDAASETKLERQNHTRLWYLIYKHMASGNAADKESYALLESGDEVEQNKNCDTLLVRNSSICQTSSPKRKQDMTMENHYDEVHKNEVIKLVEEAIDEIPFPDSQDDSPDDQSVTSKMTSEEESLRLEHGEGQKLSISTNNDSYEKSNTESNSTKEELKTKTVENKSKPQLKKNWSNLKKIILLKRFVKALEKVKKFNPQEPRYLPLQSGLQAEKVNLRHQNTDDRKNAEEWMLDHALQQVVSQLTPARKRKVQLLVEAFETVTPTTGS